MSVIENTLKRLQGQQAATGNAEATTDPYSYGTVAAAGAARRRQSSGDGAVPEGAVVIDSDALRAAGMLPPAHQEHELAQQYRRIKRPLINNALGRGVAALARGNVIMVTSAVPGEGKTFTTLNLAMSMRLEEDITVLLVDGDVVNPRISQILGVENHTGLLDAVRDPAVSAAAAILPTDIPGLAFLPAGRQDASTSELMASARMHEVVSKLGAEDPARLVLFDSAPLLVTTEAQVLAQFAGQIIVVVQADHTPQHVLFDALGTLAEDKPVSLVLNKTLRHADGYYYYYYYEYAAGARSREPGGSG